MPATISVNFATQQEVENSPQPTNKSVSAKVLADVLGGGSLGGGYVRIAGSTMTGPLTLNAAPTQNLHAATKKYVDDNAYTIKYRYNIGTATSTISPSTPAEANGRTLDFVSTLNLDVYRNGVLLVGDGVDYTANVATKTITFNTQLGVGAVVQVNVGGVGSILANPGVMQIQAGNGISLNPAGGTGTVTVTNSGVTQITAGTGVAVSSATGNVTVSLAGGNNVQFNSLGVGTAASGTTGEIRATNDITAYFSDERLKTFLGKISDSLDKVNALNGYYYKENEKAKSLGYKNEDIQVGVSAQEVEKVLPEIVTLAPIDTNTDEDGNKVSKSGENIKTVKYDKLVPLLIEAVKELNDKVKNLEAKLNS